MDSRIGVNSFPQRAQNVREKTSNVRTNDPIALEKEFGEKNLGEILNKIADPNYKASKRKVKGVGNDQLDKDAFFKLMLTQLKQQDPTNPLKSHEMAAQLAQFTSVEQLSNMNQTLAKMSRNDGQDNKFDVLNLIGKKVSGDSSRIDRLKGDKDHKVEFLLPKAADQVKVTIKDDKGIVVKKYDLSDLKKGKNQLVWNGLYDDGKEARVGNYTASIDASYQGRKLHAETKFSGAVDGVQFTSKGPVLVVDGKNLSLKDVKQIEVAKPKMNHDTKAVINPNSTMSKGAIEQIPEIANLDKVKMDQELREKLVK